MARSSCSRGFLIVLVWFFLIPPSNNREERGLELEDAAAIGAVRGDLPLAERRARGHVNDRARAAAPDPDFSRRIREGLPARFSAP
jgi:hypothetical protein